MRVSPCTDRIGNVVCSAILANMTKREQAPVNKVLLTFVVYAHHKGKREGPSVRRPFTRYRRGFSPC